MDAGHGHAAVTDGKTKRPKFLPRRVREFGDEESAPSLRENQILTEATPIAMRAPRRVDPYRPSGGPMAYSRRLV